MTLKKGPRPAALAYLVAPLTVLVVLFLAPLATMVRQSVSAAAGPGGAGGLTLGHYTRFFSDSYYLSGLFVTLATAVLVTAITVIGSYPMAYTYWRASGAVARFS